MLCIYYYFKIFSSNIEVDGKLADIIKLIGADYAKSPVVIQTKS